MKNFAKILSVLIVFIMALSINAYATEADDTAATDSAQQETAAPDATAPEEETTQPEEETTTQPEIEEPTVPETPTEPTNPTDPTEPSEPAEPEIALPKAPTEITAGSEGFGYRYISWDAVEGAEGYEVYIKTDGEWVYLSTTKTTTEFIENLISNSEYEVAVKSYITVDGEKLLSEEFCTGVFSTSASVQTTRLTLAATKDGIKLYWDTCDGVSGYRLFVKKDGSWVKIKDINSPDESVYLYEDAEKNTKYQFSIRTFANGTKGTKWGTRVSKSIKYPDFTKSEITSCTLTNSSVTINWRTVEDAAGYRVYIYKNNKWTYYKGIKKTTYKVTGLEASTIYKVKVRAYYQENGKTTWGTYSDVMTVTTKSKTVKASRVANLKKYFTDGDWSVKVANMVDTYGDKFDYTVSVKGNKINLAYDYKDKNIIDFEYLIDVDKETVYLIIDSKKTYAVLDDESAAVIAYSAYLAGSVLDMSTAKNVTAKTAVYSGKTGVAETYKDKDINTTKTFYFVNDKITALTAKYSDGSSETFKISKITDTPSASLFKVPSGYKKVAY